MYVIQGCIGRLYLPHEEYRKAKTAAVLWIRIQIRMFMGLMDPDPLVRGTEPDPSFIKQKM